MTVRKHFKQLIRERMTKTGESYTTARRFLIQDLPQQSSSRSRWHLPGNIPATSGLRILLAAAGLSWSEAAVFGIAGGIGIGVAQFRYEKEDFSSFFLAGRYSWYDDLAYFQTALKNLEIKSQLKETTSAKAAATHLNEALESGPCLAWVDMALLPHRALPASMIGGGYHVITIYQIDGNQAIIGDMTDEPIPIGLDDLSKARARISKQKNRLLTIASCKTDIDLPSSILRGLQHGYQALTSKPGKGPLALSTLESLRRWCQRLHGSKDKDSWEKIFPPGSNLWRGLTSIYQFIEMYGTGGGLCRPMMAECLEELAKLQKDRGIAQVAKQYRSLSKLWSDLAGAALPASVPMLKEARELHNQYAELLTTGGSISEKQEVWSRLDELAKSAKAKFPLTESACDQLREQLQSQLTQIIAAEEAALHNLSRFLP